MNYSRLLCKADYALFEEHKEVEALVNAQPGLFRYEHEHRKWEYGLCLKFLKSATHDTPQDHGPRTTGRTVLEVGGGGSPLSAMLALRGYEVTVLDPWDASADLKRQTAALGHEVRYVPEELLGFADREAKNRQFDFVVSTSVVEHVPFDHAFVDAMARLARRATFLTTDFHPTGQPFSQAHHRTYNEVSLFALGTVQARRGFELADDAIPRRPGCCLPEWDYRPEHELVYQYTFASLAMVKAI